MKKKGALDLSINSIVVIIFAITMLGIGLMFIKGQFDAVQDKLTFPPPPVEGTPGEPIVMPFETLKVNRGTDVDFSLNFYNDGAYGDVQASKKPVILDCTPDGLEDPLLTGFYDYNNDNIADVELQSVGQFVPVASKATYKALFVVPSDAQSQKYICVLGIGTGVGSDTTVASKQFFVEVK